MRTWMRHTVGIFKWTTWNSKCTQCFFWPLFCTRKTGLLGIKDRCGVSLVANLLTYGFAGDGPTLHLPDVLHLLLHLLFLHQRLKILLHGPLLNLDARYFVKHARMGHDFHHFISHVAKETLQNPNQIKPSGQITPNAFKTTASSVHPLWHHHI